MSGMLGQLLGGLMGGGQQPAQQSPMFAILQQVLASGGGSGSAGGGGLATLISRFQAAGLGQQAQSWVGTGQNLPVAPDQLEQVFTPTQIDSWARQAGTSPDAMRQVLSQALPHVVDHMTPGGQVPPPSADLSGLLMRVLSGGTTRQT